VVYLSLHVVCRSRLVEHRLKDGSYVNVVYEYNIVQAVYLNTLSIKPDPSSVYFHLDMGNTSSSRN